MNERLVQIRKAVGLTQTEFAAKLGISRSNIGSYETRATALSSAVIRLVCKTFNVNETWLRTGEGEMFKPVDRESELAMFMGEVMADEDDSFRKRFLAALVKLDVEDWKVIEKLATEMTKGLGDNA